MRAENRDRIHLHHRMEMELFQNKSIPALIWLIGHGRELEFQVGSAACFLSQSGSAKAVSLWEGESEQPFDTMEKLLLHATIGGRPFLAAWADAVLDTLF